MKISQIAAATLVPATLAGVVLTAMPFAHAAPAPAHAQAARHVASAPPAKPATVAKRATATKRATPHIQTAAQKAPSATANRTAGTRQPASNRAPAPAQTQPVTVSQPLTAGMSSFEQCVAWRESGDNPTASSAGLFGILPVTWASLGFSGTAGQASVAQQKAAFSLLYAQDGTSPWAPYDGC
jgi:hypothetical protein